MIRAHKKKENISLTKTKPSRIESGKGKGKTKSPNLDPIFPLRIIFVFFFTFFVQCQSSVDTSLSHTENTKNKIQKEILSRWETLSPSSIKSVTYLYMMGDGEIHSGQIGNGSNGTVDRFKIGSITKLFTGISILQLQDAGKLKLDDKVSKYLPEIKLMRSKKVGYREITIRDLLTHQSGLPSDLANGFFLPPDSSEEEILKSFRSLPKSLINLERNEPGKIHSYSNLSFGLLGNVIERASGESIEGYFQKHIFEKAGMKHTTLLEFLPNSELITGYSGFLWKTKTIRPVIRDLTAGSISTTGEDMGLFMKAFFKSKQNNGLLSSVSFAEFHKTQNGPKANFEMKLGLPVMKNSYVADGNTIWFYGHSGSLPPFFADLIYDPKTEIVSFVAGNTLGLQTGKLKGTNTGIMELLWEEKMGVHPETNLSNLSEKKETVFGEEGYYISPMGIHEYKKGNPPKLSLMGIDVGLVEKENRFGIDLRVLFGLVSIKDPKIEAMRVEFETWEGNSIFTLYDKDLPKGVAGIGVKFTPDNRFPDTKYFGTFFTKETYAIIPKLKLEKDKRGFPLLTIYYELGGMENSIQVPCHWESQNTLRILGYGRNLNETVTLGIKNQKPILIYSGGEYEIR
ncbi:beta-lactamase [Leptospira yanagawae serovar Saopaulo str. Sao Paulo = ATCC 700523]|uniref:Beta-lactamase n=1 Tax=Leptospira yanagawae serovar Saopaulo str. Sao Paulo = ATCC 700523 TaxID=1249483 RepID=A0A5E8HE97_9LEPT|nr:serine hydrolase domain-containing protein [Leptospira yanagawae]EOQ89117.1 beta-lactamase [Leptospira yanagawae serovar Saopaulo str. Sao Paulo = ATCC 700523]